jgi:hypothetical protein
MLYFRLVNDTDEVEESRGCMAGLFNRLRRGSGDSDVSEASEMLELSTMGEFGSVELPIPLTNLQVVIITYLFTLFLYYVMQWKLYFEFYHAVIKFYHGVMKYNELIVICMNCLN